MHRPRGRVPRTLRYLYDRAMARHHVLRAFLVFARFSRAFGSHVAINQLCRARWEDLLYQLVHPANVWIRATRYNTAHFLDISIDSLGEDYAAEIFRGTPEFLPEFLDAAPAYAVSQTHCAVRDSALLKLYAPLTVTQETSMHSPCHVSADAKTVTALDPAMFAFLEGTRVFSASRLDSSWVISTVMLLEAIAGLAITSRVSLSVCQVSPRPFDDRRLCVLRTTRRTCRAHKRC